MKRKSFVLTVLVLALVLSATVGSALAYFTANASAEGSVPVKVGGGTQMKEEVGSWQKVITISYDTSDPNNTQPVYVRFRAFGPTYSNGEGALTVTGDGWTQVGDWYYYNQALDPEHPDASLITVAIKEMSRAQYDKFLEEGDGLDVIVVYESAPALYKEDGSLMDPWAEAVWTQKVVSTRSTFTPGESSPEGGN